MAANRFSPGNPCCSGYTVWWHIRPTIDGVARDVLFRTNERIVRSSLNFTPPRYFVCPIVSGTNATIGEPLNYDGFWLAFANGSIAESRPTRFYKIDQDSFEIVWEISLPDPAAFPFESDNFNPGFSIVASSSIICVDKFRNGTGGDGVVYLQIVRSSRTIVACVNYKTGEIVQDWALRKIQPSEGPTMYETDATHRRFYVSNNRTLSIAQLSSATTYCVSYRWREDSYTVSGGYSGSRSQGYSSRWEAGRMQLVTSGSGYIIGTTAEFSGDGDTFSDTVTFSGASTLPDYPRAWDVGGQFVNQNDSAASVAYVHPFDDENPALSGVYYSLVYLHPPVSSSNLTRQRDEFWRIPPVVHTWPGEFEGLPFPDGYYQETGTREFPSGTSDGYSITIGQDPSNGAIARGVWQPQGPAPIRMLHFRGVHQNVLYWNDGATNLMAFYPHWSTYGFNNANLGEVAGPLLELPHPDRITLGEYRFAGDMEVLTRINTALNGYFFNYAYNWQAWVPTSLGWSNYFTPVSTTILIAKADNFSEKQET